MESRKLRSGLGLILLALLLASPGIAGAQAAGAGHGRIYGVVQTEEQSVANIFDRDTTIIVRALHNSRSGRIVAISKVTNGHYSVDMDDLPAGQYLVSVDPGGDSQYLPGESLIKYPGGSASIHQNWTLSMYQSAIPHRQ